MKVETPQILWHNGAEGNGKPAPLYSVSLLPSSLSSSSPPTSRDGDILATAGNTNEVHIWNIQFAPVHSPHRTNTSASTNSDSGTSGANENDHPPCTAASPTQGPSKRRKILSPTTSPSTTIQHITTLTRHQRSINTISFSPQSNHLATAGDGGSFILYTIPSKYRKSKSTRNHFWKNVLKEEKDLTIKVLNTHAEDIMDLSWSMDDKRVILGSLDHAVFVFEEVVSYTHHPVSSNGSGINTVSVSGTSTISAGAEMMGSASQWNCVWRNTKEHTHYVQGVAYDPLGVYVASQGSDRSVRVWQRKRGGRAGGGNGAGNGSGANHAKKHSSSVKKKGVLATMDGNVNINVNENQVLNDNGNLTSASNRGSATNTIATANSGLWTGKFEVGKAKMVKYRTLDKDNSNSSTNTNTHTNHENNNNNTTTSTTTKKRHLFADESSVESFFRRLAWTQDGAFLITPASLWHPSSTTITSQNETTSTSSSPSFATYLFARHQYEQPYKVLHGLEKPSVVIRPNPRLFKLPKDVQSYSKENLQQHALSHII